MDVKIIFFKDTGKYYTEETVKLPAEIAHSWQAADWLRENVRQHRGMYLIAMLDELPSGCPVLIPASER